MILFVYLIFIYSCQRHRREREREKKKAPSTASFLNAHNGQDWAEPKVKSKQAIQSTLSKWEMGTELSEPLPLLPRSQG